MKPNSILKVIILCAAMFIGTNTFAQWQTGIKTGMNITAPDRSQAGRVDEIYSAGTGWIAGATVQYNFLEWLALRTEIDVTDRTHRMDRNIRYIDPVYTVYHNTYLMVPVMADFSFGGRKVRGHLYTGGFAGYWLTGNREGTTFWMTDFNVYFSPFNEKIEFTDEDNRFTAGLTAGAGLSYNFIGSWGLDLGAMYFHDLASYHNSSPHISDPRYLSSISITLGISYKF